MPERDYTGSMYAKLVATVAKQYKAYPVLEYYERNKSGSLHDRYLIMRHDVDADVTNALHMARIDAAHGVRSTFYFRMKPLIFDPGIIKQIKSMGHEIGYHYEVLSDTKGNYEQGRRLFLRNLQRLRKIVPVHTACMHGRSLSRIDNLDFFRHYALEAFDLVVEPYLSIDYADKYYFTDTGLCWNNQQFNIRDNVRSKGSGGVCSTNELIEFMKSSIPERASLLTHTNNWVDNLFLWSVYKASFFLLNRIKSSKKKLAARKSLRVYSS